MKKLLAQFILFVIGWKESKENPFPRGIDKAVLMVAPHTSHLDFYIGLLIHNYVGNEARFLIKKEFFVFPFNILLRLSGAVPVDRGRDAKLVYQVCQYFANSKRFMLTVTPEGTRQKTPHWKKGFYTIAQKAEAPILVGYLDYGKKQFGVFEMVDANKEDINAELKRMRGLFKNITAKVPEQFTVGDVD